MNKDVNKLIPIIIKELHNQKYGLLNCDKNDKIGIDKKVNGYITSLATAILQSGLFSSIAFFDKKINDKPEEQLKPNLSKLIAYIMSDFYKKRYENGDRLIDMLLREYQGEESVVQKNLDKFQKELLNVLIASKLSVRTFYLYEDES